jgi:hypothetical protein
MDWGIIELEVASSFIVLSVSEWHTEFEESVFLKCDAV